MKTAFFATAIAAFAAIVSGAAIPDAEAEDFEVAPEVSEMYGPISPSPGSRRRFHDAD